MRPLYSENEWPTLAAYDLEADYWTDITLVCHVDEYGNRLHFTAKDGKGPVAHYVDWLFSEFPGDVLFAHAGGHYDHRFLMHECHSRGWDFDTAISGGSIVLATINNGKRTIKFVDSYRLMPDSLKKIGDTVGLPKLDVDASKLHELSPAETLEYCYRDCDIVLKGLQLMRTALTRVGADFAFTLASIAARYNRRNPGIDWDHFVLRQGKKLVRHPTVELWDKECYHAYFGGRCEMFERGIFGTELETDEKEHIFNIPKGLEWYDIVSSYPTSMLEPLPLYYLGFFTPPKNLKNVEKFLSHCGITRCTIYVPPAHLSCLPVKDPKTGRLTFPADDTLTGYWTNIELLEAIKHGAKIRSIVGQYRFEAVPFLRKFVETFYQLRQDAKNRKDEFQTYAYKILLNSSYGKLVETIERRSFCTASALPRAMMQMREQGLSEKQIADRIETTNTQGVFCVRSESVGPFRHTAAGAYITAYSRLRLFRMAKEMHDKGATLYYCDTDSLMLDMKIPETGSKLGDWEHVATLKELELILPKVYRAVPSWHEKGKLDPIYKCKGCPIERKFETKDMAEKRWHAFKNFRFSETAEQAEILGKDGVTGFVSDIREGSLMPRRLQESCKTCKKSGKVKGLDCPACGGKGHRLKPLVRALKSEDKKRVWTGHTSRPISYSKDKEAKS